MAKNKSFGTKLIKCDDMTLQSMKSRNTLFAAQNDIGFVRKKKRKKNIHRDLDAISTRFQYLFHIVGVSRFTKKITFISPHSQRSRDERAKWRNILKIYIVLNGTKQMFTFPNGSGCPYSHIHIRAFFHSHNSAIIKLSKMICAFEIPIMTRQ